MEGTYVMVLRTKQDEDGRSEEEGKDDKSITGGRWNKQEDRNKEDP